MKSDPMRSLTIQLSAKQLAKLNAAVDGRTYTSSSEIVSAALHLWEQHEVSRQMEIARLKHAYEEGVASGEPLDGDTAFTQIRAKVFGKQTV